MSQSDIELVCVSVTQQIQEQSAKYGVDAELSGYAALTRPTELPQSWLQTNLGDVVDYGKVEKAEPNNISDDTWVLELEDIEKDNSKITQRLNFLARQSKSTKNKFKKGDVLYGKLRPYLNKVVVADSDGVCTTEIIPLSGGEHLNNQYLFFWLKHPDFLAYVSEVGYGVNMPRLGTKDGIAAPFVLAPLAEQQQIAAKLDELLAQVDTLKTRLDTIPKILKRFRQSVLAAAVSGKLTEDWRIDDYISVNLNLSKHNFELLIPKCWRIAALEKSCKILSGNAFKSDKFIGSGIPVIKISNIQYGEFEIKNQQFLPASFLEIHSKFKVEPSDLLMALTRPITNNTLKVCRYPDHAEIGLLNQRVCKFTFKNESEKKYFEILFQSDYFKSQVEDNLSETLQPNLSPADLKKFVVAIPDGEEQTEIVRRVEQLFTYADQIEQRVKDAQARVNHLTQSILAKAFRGELTADWREQNLDLISGENSAEALLAKIKTERESIATTKKIGRKVKA